MSPRRALALLLLGALSLACASDLPRGGPRPLAAEIAGCAAMIAGPDGQPLCQLDERGALTAWVPLAAGAALEVRVDQRPSTFERTAIQGGARLRIPVPASARTLRILTRPGAAFTLALEPSPPVPALIEAEALRQSAKLAEAEARLAGPLADPRPELRARALGKLARILRRRGQPEPAVLRFREAIALDRAAGRLSDEFLDRFALAFTLVNDLQRFAEAREALAPLDDLGALHPEGRAVLPFYQAKIAFDSGDLRVALRLAQEAERGSERLDLQAQRLDTLEMEADILRSLGRFGEAADLLARVRRELPPSASACRRAQLLANQGWLLLGVEERAASRLPEQRLGPLAILEEAVALYRSGCPQPALLSNALTNLAEAEVLHGGADRARALLDEARRAEPQADVQQQASWIGLEGRLSLREGRPEQARALFERMLALAESALLPEERLRATLGTAEAEEALGLADEADRAYAAAERLLDESSLLAPLGEGRATFLGARDEGTRRYLDFLLGRDPARAAEAARRSRARILASTQGLDRLSALGGAPQQRWERARDAYRRTREQLDADAASDWKLPADRLASTRAERSAAEARLRAALDEALAALWPDARARPDALAPLPTSAPGELLLVYHPIIDGWAGFMIRGDTIVARRLGPLRLDAPPGALSEQLLGPFREAIDAAHRLRVLACGAVEAIDFHALPWGGAPLLEHLPVTYGVDLPHARPAAPRGDKALLVADPRNDLPSARDEAREIGAGLVRRGLSPTSLIGRAATHRAVRDALEDPETALFHYAGHGFFGGRDGWESGLPLAGGGWLTVGDLLALRRVPGLVLLSGCETAAPTEAVGFGLAQTFIAAGAEAAIASSRRLDDAQAERMMKRVHAALAAGSARDPAAALREAQLATRREEPDADWSSFRVFVP